MRIWAFLLLIIVIVVPVVIFFVTAIVWETVSIFRDKAAFQRLARLAPSQESKRLADKPPREREL